MADIFISHIHEEAEASEALAKFLREYGFQSFLSSERWQLRAGERWFDKVTKELDQAKVVILMLTNVSVARPWINFEAGWAWAKSKVTIPACFGGLKPGHMPRPYSDVQGVDLTESVHALMWDIHHHLGRPGLPPPPKHSDAEVQEILQKFVPADNSARQNQ